MAKAGRKPKQNVERHACGKIKRSLSSDKGIMLVAADLAAIQQMRLNPMWRTQIGRLTAAGELSIRHFDAANKLARLRAETDRILGTPARYPRGVDLNAIGGRDIDDEARLTPEEMERKGAQERAKMNSFYAAEARLGNGSKIQAAVQSVVYYDMAPVGYQQLLDLREGLKILAEFWKMA